MIKEYFSEFENIAFKNHRHLSFCILNFQE